MRLLIVADIHGNWPALEAVLNAERKIDGIICLGDIVNFGPHPVACVESIQDRGMPGWIVRGNHDHAVGFGVPPDCADKDREMALSLQRFTQSQLTASAVQYLRSLPTIARGVLEQTRFVLCHAVPSDPLGGYLGPDDFARWEEEVILAGSPHFLLVAHTHRPFVRLVRDTFVVNPGSVGQPQDRDPIASYALWNSGAVDLLHAAYDKKSVLKDLEGCAAPSVVAKLRHIFDHGSDRTSGWFR